MVFRGTVQNGEIVLDDPVTLPEGASVRVEFVSEPRPGHAAEFRGVVNRELDRLADLQPNWDAEGASRIDPSIIALARSFAAAVDPNLSDPPKVVPMAKGNLQFEWNDGGRTLELEFELPQTVHYLRWDTEEDVEDEGLIDVGDTERCEELIRWFREGVAHV